MPDEAELAIERQNIDDYERRLAKDIALMLLETRVNARRVLMIVDAILNLPVEEPRPPAQGDELGPRQPSPN
jgi:hypothetical protein